MSEHTFMRAELRYVKRKQTQAIAGLVVFSALTTFDWTVVYPTLFRISREGGEYSDLAHLAVTGVGLAVDLVKTPGPIMSRDAASRSRGCDPRTPVFPYEWVHRTGTLCAIVAAVLDVTAAFGDNTQAETAAACFSAARDGAWLLSSVWSVAYVSSLRGETARRVSATALSTPQGGNGVGLSFRF